MRNLKRALSLALASVMLLGMMVVGTSAASYPDVSAEDNVEAIEVLNAVGVMIGDRGNFRPDDGLNRHEMAVIMAKLMLGTEAADNYVGTHPFTDVVPWADKYVAACYNEGIISGTSSTTYGGSQPLTAIQAAAMMLRALGYEDLSKNATDWRTPVAAKANEIRLFKNVVSSPSAELTRNQVAQLTLNTLKSTVVTTEGQGGTVTTPDGTVVNLGNLKYVDREVEVSTGSNVYAIALDPKAAATSTPTKYTLQLGENLYDGDLELKNVAADDFGRPASKWVYDNEDIITVADDATETYIGGVKTKDIYKDLGLSTTISSSNVTVKVDGANGTDGNAARDIDDSTSTKFGADGQTVEVFYDKNAGTVKIAIVSSYLGVVTDDDAKSDGKTGIRVHVSGVGTKFFETEAGYAEDDVVLLTMANGKIKEITGTPKTATGEVTRLGSDGAMTISGTKYPQAAQFDVADGDVIKGESSPAVSNSYTLYLDANGCYLAAVEVEDNTDTNLVYVFDVDANDFLNTSDNKVERKIMATVVDMDGTHRDVPVTYTKTSDAAAAKPDVTDGNVGTTKTNLQNAFKGKLAYLTYDEDDKEYTLTVSAQYDGDYNTTEITLTGDVKLEAGDRNTKFGASTVYYLNSKTVYLFVSEDDDGDLDKVEIFTGGVDATLASGKKVAVGYEDNNRTGYVVVNDAFTASADDVIYITDTTSKGDVKDGMLFKGYRVGTDSEEQEIAIQTGANGADVADDGTGFYSYTSVKSNGNLDKLTAHASDAAHYVVGKAIASLVDGDGAFTGSANNKVYDFTKAVIVDLRDEDDQDALCGEISGLSALNKAKKDGNTITVSAYINGDDEVVGLFVTNVVAPPVADTTAPTLSTAEITGTSLVLTYNETLGNSTPATSDFTVAGIAAGTTVSSVAVSGTKVTLTMASAAVSTDTVTVSYTPGTNKIQDSAGNAAAALTTQAVTNKTVPTVVSATINGTSLVITFTENLKNTSIASSAFTVTGVTAGNTISTVAINNTVTITLANAAVSGDGVNVKVSYTAPSDATALQTAGGAKVASFANQAVTNNTP